MWLNLTHIHYRFILILHINAVLLAVESWNLFHPINSEYQPCSIGIGKTVMPTTQPLLDIADALVSDSDSHPARSDGTLDHERCARLHNYLVACGWIAESGRGTQAVDDFSNWPSFFERDGDEVEEIRDRLDPALVAFLESVIMTDSHPFFIWVSGLTLPSDMLISETMFPEDENNLIDKERFVLLYTTSYEFGGHTVGLVYDQQRHRAALPMVIEYIDFVSPVEEHLDMWHPLETILSNWIHMIRIGKVTVVSSEGLEDETFNSIGPWTWQPYSTAQVNGTVAAFDRLSAAIEARMPPGSLLPATRDTPLLTDEDLDAASAPSNCFIRSVLTQVKTPRFITIAPGLGVPHDATAFAACQKFTTMPRNPDDGTVIPPVLIFAAINTSQTVDFDSDSQYICFNPFRPFLEAVPYGDHSTPAGLYSESVHRGDYFPGWRLFPDMTVSNFKTSC